MSDRPSSILSQIVPVPKGRSSLYLFISVLILSLAIIQAPSFLFISEAPVKADAVVLFLGGAEGAREKEAEQLIREGFADYLIIPAYGQIKKRTPDGTLEAFTWKRPENVSHQETNQLTNQSNRSFTNRLTNQRNWFTENTHIEVLEAKRLMEDLGLNSALFVSSPYHMRRIKLINSAVTLDNIIVNYVSTRYETLGEDFWLFDSRASKIVLTEYAKIAWFLLYTPFGSLSACSADLTNSLFPLKLKLHSAHIDFN